MHQKFQITRLFTGEAYKGSRGYIYTQKRYEILRTIIYFAISISLFVAGIIATGDKLNLLTIVAVLGCLPASKSAVNMIMFLRYQSMKETEAEQIAECTEGLSGLYDMVFTSYSRTYVVDHMVIKGNTICGYSVKTDFPEKEFQNHLEPILKADDHKNVSIKIFTDLNKYIERLKQLQSLETNEGNTDAIIKTLKSVVL